MFNSLKRALRFVGSKITTDERPPKFIDKMGDYDKKEIIKAYKPGPGPG